MSTRIHWEGSFFANHSLALVNREVVGRLAQHPELRVSISSQEVGTGLDWDHDRVAKLRMMEVAPAGEVDVSVRHRWPLDPAPPRAGKWVIFQPWEFGSLRRDWYEPMRFGADEVWVYSSFNKQCYVESGIPEEKIRVIPLGVHETMLTPPAAFPLRTRKRFKFLFLGGTIMRKGIDQLVDAYVREFSRDDDVCLVVKDFGVGSFYKGQTYDHFLRELQGNPRLPEIEYLDAELTAEQIRDLYHACDCLVHPFRGEGFGLPIAEAMACGLPVVVPDQGGASDFCTDETAVLLPSRRVAIPNVFARGLDTVGTPWWLEVRVDALRERMREIYRRPEGVREVAERGRALIHERFTWANAAEHAAAGLTALSSSPSRAVRTDPAEQHRLWMEDGVRRWSEGDAAGALHRFVRAREHREDEDVLFNLSVLNLESGDFAGAKGLLERLRALQGTGEPGQREAAAETENLLGVCHSSLGDYASARAHFRAALALVPDLPVAQQNLRELDSMEPVSGAVA